MGLTFELSDEDLMKVLAFLFWCFLYLWVAVTLEKDPEWCSRAVTLLHGSVAAVVGWNQCDFQSKSYCSRASANLTFHQHSLMLWSWGYFAFDILWCLEYWRDNAIMLFHHGCALTAITMYLNKGFAGSTVACGLTMMEITNPLLQTRWFLKYAGYEKSMVFFIVDASFLLVFVAVRGILGTYAMYKILPSEKFDIQEKLMSLAFYIISAAFLYDIYGYVVYKYKDVIVNGYYKLYERLQCFRPR